MADENTPASENKNEAEAPAKTEESSLENDLYTTMEGEKKPADDKPKDDEEKPGEEAEGEPEAGTPDDKKKEGVEDDNLIGIEEPEGDKDEKPADEEKPADDKPKDDEEKPGEDKPPEDYKLQLPENSLLGADAVKQAEEYAKENGLSQKAAEAHLKAKENAVEEYQDFLDNTAEQRAQETMVEKKKEWFAEAKADPVIGGENFNETVAKGNRFFNSVANESDRALFKATGMGNHKNIMGLFARATDKFGLMDDNIDLGGEGNEADKELADQLYTTM